MWLGFALVLLVAQQRLDGIYRQTLVEILGVSLGAVTNCYIKIGGGRLGGWVGPFG
jgi:hypothetical protein